MNLTLLKSKIHRAVVTQSDLHYEGSITIDADLVDAAGLLAHEQVDILNVTNGQRFTTYVLVGARGGGDVCLNGAAARRVQNGDLVIICAYASMTADTAATFKPTVVFVDDDNKITSTKDKSGHAASVTKGIKS